MTKPKHQNRETGPAAAGAAAVATDQTTQSLASAAGATQEPQGGTDEEDEDEDQDQGGGDPQAAAPPAPPASSTRQPQAPPRPKPQEPIPAAPATAADPRFAELVPEQNGRMDAVAVSLLLEACDRFGVNPALRARPQELLAWKFYQSPDENQPDAVVFVTGGGLKLKHWDDPDHPMDLDTLDRLRRTFGLFKIDPQTKDLVILDLPEDLTLPRTAVDGKISAAAEHRYEGGYLRSGGKTAAQKKEERRQARTAKLGLA